MFFNVLRTQFLIFLCWEYFGLCCSAGVDPSETKLIFYYGPELNDSSVYNLSDAADILNNENFDINEDTHFYLHGYLSDQSTDSVVTIVEAYLKRETVNLISVDWSKAAGGGYGSTAWLDIQVLAPALADAILDLYNAGVEQEKLQLVGHSLGAQLAGMTGRNVIEKTEGKTKIYRIAALDAALPLFVTATVNKYDAEFVQAIHTDAGVYGQIGSIGHVDFWPNGGVRVQPGCPLLALPFTDDSSCSHMRAPLFWAESVANVNGTQFLGYPSRSYFKFLLDGQSNRRNKPVQMGIDCPMDARGDYYLKTNSEPPFAKGVDAY